jgi:hypothetical protein
MATRQSNRENTTLRFIVLSLVAVLVGGGLLWWASDAGAWDGHGTAQTFVSQIGSLIIASVALALIWDLVGKRAFASEVLESARVGADVAVAGLLQVGTSYLEDVQWRDLFENSSKIDLFFAYAGTWRGAYHVELERFVARGGTRLRVFLPDCDDEPAIRDLAIRFSLDEPELKNRIRQARADFVALGARARVDVAVYFHTGDSLFSAYRFDRTAIVTLYSHARNRRNVPTFVCRDGGSLYEFVREELRSIEEQSRVVYPTTETEGKT